MILTFKHIMRNIISYILYKLFKYESDRKKRREKEKRETWLIHMQDTVRHQVFLIESYIIFIGEKNKKIIELTLKMSYDIKYIDFSKYM